MATKRRRQVISDKQKVAVSNINRNYTQKSSAHLSHIITTAVLTSLTMQDVAFE
jgi:hypothetical protein